MKNSIKLLAQAGLILLLSTSALLAQKLTLTGVVKDSYGAPLEMANVVAINQATKALDGFGITDTKGRYRINVNGNSSYEVKVSFIGYEPATLTLKTAGADLSQDVTLQEQAESLDEVELTYEIPVTIKGDTIVYNTDSFATGTEKKLEDLVKNLPGMTVNAEGQIEVEGKSVTKVMIDGKEFFDGDTKLASKNIPAKALDKIEVLRNYSEVGQLRGVTDNQDNVVLNIKLKTGKDKFWFGEFAAAAGADDTFLAHPKLFYYSPTTSVNLITDFNNIGSLPFTTRDYFNFTGGMRNLTRRGGTSFNPASNNLGISLLQNDRALFIDTKFGAFNFSHAPSEELTLSGFAIYSYTGTDLKNESQRTYIVSNQNETTTSLTNQKSTLGLAKLSSSYKPSAALQWDYDLLYKNSLQDEDRSVTSIAQVTDVIQEDNNQNPISLTQNTSLYYTLTEDHIFSVEAQHLYDLQDPIYEAERSFLPFTGLIPFDTSGSQYRIGQEKLVKTRKWDARGEYYYVLSPKSNLNLTLGTIYSNQDFNSGIFQVLNNQKVTIPGNQLSNEVTFRFSDVFVGAHLKFVTGIFTWTPGFNLHRYGLEDIQFGDVNTQNSTNLVPDVAVNVQLKKSETIRFNYGVTREFTDINRIAEGYVLNGYNNLYQGNRDLESALFHQVSLNYFSFNMFNFENIFARLSYSKRIDPFKNNTTIVGINQINSTINSMLEDEVANGSFNYQRTWGKIRWSSNAGLNYSSLNNIVNNAPRNSTSIGQNYTASLGTQFKKAPNVELGYTYTLNRYDNAGRVSEFSTERPFARLNWVFLKNFNLSAEYDDYHFKNLDGSSENEYAFLKSTLSFQKQDSHWEWSLVGTNLTNTLSLNQDSFSEFLVSSSAYYVQPRYVLLQLKYEL